MNNLTSILAVFCDRKGFINKIIRDDFCLNLSQGQLFISIFNIECTKKAEIFFNTINFQKEAFNWELTIKLSDNLRVLNFAGGVVEDGIFIVASSNQSDVESFYEELMKINNEQINLLRTTLKEQIINTDKVKKHDSSIYDELTKLNNELANTQRELAKKNIELENLNNLKNTFLGMAAHDLRNPLGAILSFSDFLLEETSEILNSEQIEFLSIIHSSSNFMLGLINNLLDISKIESGKLELDLTKTDLLSLIKNNIRINQVLAEKKNIKILIQTDNEIPEVFVDKNKIEQVLNNLITNAVKFSMKNTTIEVLIKNNGKEIIITVKDQGLGIPENEIEKLFKPFQKTSVKSTGGEESTGLGLLIVKKIIDGHKGRIWVESIVGVGTSFIFSLPLV